MKNNFFGLLAICCSISLQAAMKCPGSGTLYDRRYNQVSYPGAHNVSTLSKFPFIDIRNQDEAVNKMLNAGIRFMKLPVHRQDNTDFICHGISNSTKKGIVKSCVGYAEKLERGVEEKLGKFFGAKLKKAVGEPIRLVCNEVNKMKPCSVDNSKLDLKRFTKTLYTFLNTHPHAIVTLLIEDYTGDYQSIHKAFETVRDYMYYPGIEDTHKKYVTNKAWPRLCEMINSKKRLVVFVDRDWAKSDKPGSLFVRQKDFIFENDWEYKTINDLMKNISIINRGKSNYNNRNNPPKNKLWLMWNMVTPLTGGSLKSAKIANRSSCPRGQVCLKRRLAQFKKKFNTGNPNFVAVDFFEHPKQNGLFAFVNWVNDNWVIK